MPWSISTQIIASTVKNPKLPEMINKKYIWVFIFQKYGKFWSVSQHNFIKHKPLFSEEWQMTISFVFLGHLGGQHTPSQQLPIVTLAASNLLMPPPASLGGLSSHSSNEDCSGCSYAVKHKLQEHLMQKHRRECTTCALKMGNITGGK